MRQFARQDEGSAVVEFVFVSMMLLALVLGVLQLALILHVKNTVQDAASEGARWAALADSSPAAGMLRTKELITSSVGAAYSQNVSVTTTTWLGVPAVAVTVRAPLPVLGLWGPVPGLEVTGHAPREYLG